MSPWTCSVSQIQKTGEKGMKPTMPGLQSKWPLHHIMTIPNQLDEKQPLEKDVKIITHLSIKHLPPIVVGLTS